MVPPSIPLLIGLTAFLFAAVGVLFFLYSRLRRRLTAFMQGQNAASLEQSLRTITERNTVVEKTLTAHKQALEDLHARLSGSIRGLSLVRYNAFHDVGGLQSFAAGFLDEHGNGFILSIVASRNHVGIYAKPVEEFASTVELTKEEAEALKKAQEQQRI